jgi:hypothetical protein
VTLATGALSGTGARCGEAADAHVGTTIKATSRHANHGSADFLINFSPSDFCEPEP